MPTVRNQLERLSFIVQNVLDDIKIKDICSVLDNCDIRIVDNKVVVSYCVILKRIKYQIFIHEK